MIRRCPKCKVQYTDRDATYRERTGTVVLRCRMCLADLKTLLRKEG